MAFPFGAFPLGSPATCHPEVLEEKKRHRLPCQTGTQQGGASKVLGVLQREPVSADNPNLGFVFSLTSLPSPSCMQGMLTQGRLGGMFKTGHLHNFLAFVLKILWRKSEHPKVARNFALLVGSPLRR